MKPLISLLFLLFPGLLYSQSDSIVLNQLSSFVKNIQTFNHLYPQEKVYLHFDNTGYFLGETLWFKAYVTTATDLRPTPMSRVLYVELLDAEGYTMNTQKLRIENGQADGAIPLTRLGMKSGFHEVRAYTRPMLNWDAENIFSRVFPVFESPDKTGDYDKKTIRIRPRSYYNVSSKRAKPAASRELNVSFFPEGGNLVQGLTSTVAFKLTDKEGRPLKATGCVRNPQGDTLSVFSTIYEGMGSFSYTPDHQKNQVWIQAEGDKKSRNFELPVSDPEGCIMQVQSLHPELLRIGISGSAGFSSTALGLTVSCRGKVCFFKIIDSSSLSAGHLLSIPKTELPGGVNQLTLFTADGKILSERLVYIPDPEQVQISVHSQKNSYEAFAPVHMEVSVNDKKGNPVETSLSLSVRDERTEIPSSHWEDIRSNLLLSSDLKGHITNPGYYFESDDRPRRLALDLLMLTQGYRRYDWSQMAGITSFEPSQPIEKGILVEGDVRSLVRKRVKENLDVKIIFYSDSGYQSASCTTDNEGTFNYLAEDFYGKWNLQLETWKKNKRQENWITLNRQFSPQARSYSFYDTYIPREKAGPRKSRLNGTETGPETSGFDLVNDSLELENLSQNAKTLKEVVVKGKRNWTDVWNEGSSIVYDVPEEENKLEDQAKAYNENIYEFLARVNPFFSYDILPSDSAGHPRYVAKYRGKGVVFTFSKGASRNMNLEISGTGGGFMTASTETLSDPTQAQTLGINPDPQSAKTEDDLGSTVISMITSSEVAAIAIIEDPVYARRIYPQLSSSSKPVVLIDLRLYASRNAKSHEPVGVRLTNLQGFSIPRQFYNPSYAAHSLPEESDFRRTLYWNPNVKTNSLGKAQVNFYNNGSCRKMSVSAETLTPEGVPGGYYGE